MASLYPASREGAIKNLHQKLVIKSLARRARLAFNGLVQNINSLNASPSSSSTKRLTLSTTAMRTLHDTLR
jgi:hypothetical protein